MASEKCWIFVYFVKKLYPSQHLSTFMTFHHAFSKPYHVWTMAFFWSDWCFLKKSLDPPRDPGPGTLPLDVFVSWWIKWLCPFEKHVSVQMDSPSLIVIASIHLEDALPLDQVFCWRNWTNTTFHCCGSALLRCSRYLSINDFLVHRCLSVRSATRSSFKTFNEVTRSRKMATLSNKNGARFPCQKWELKPLKSTNFM